MYEAFPRSDYYGGSVAVPDIHRSAPNSLAAFRFRQSPFACITTVSVIDFRIWLPSFTAYCGCAVIRSCSLSSRTGKGVSRYGEFSYLTPQVQQDTAWTTIQSIRTLSSYLSFHHAIQSQS